MLLLREPKSEIRNPKKAFAFRISDFGFPNYWLSAVLLLIGVTSRTGGATGCGGITWTSLPLLPSGIFLPGSPLGGGICSGFPVAGAVPLQDVQLSQQSLRRNLPHSRFSRPSSQPQPPLVPHEEVQLLPQLSQLSHERKRLQNLLKGDSQPESQLEQVVVQAGLQLGVGQVGLQSPQVSQPQLECLNRFSSRFRQPSSQQVSQPSQEAAGAAGAAVAAGGAESAPARQAVVTSKNAAFT
jgi:hypothetical protein